jgi:hypothetical protein
MKFWKLRHWKVTGKWAGRVRLHTLDAQGGWVTVWGDGRLTTGGTNWIGSEAFEELVAIRGMYMAYEWHGEKGS